MINLNDTSYFKIADNLEANPDNADIVSVSASELLEHFRSIIENQDEIAGNVVGTNNYRDTVQDKSRGTRILQHESSLLPLIFLLSNKDIFNVTEHIRAWKLPNSSKSGERVTFWGRFSRVFVPTRRYVFYLKNP